MGKTVPKVLSAAKGSTRDRDTRHTIRTNLDWLRTFYFFLEVNKTLAKRT